LDKQTTITLRVFLIIGVMLHHYWGAEKTIVLYFSRLPVLRALQYFYSYRDMEIINPMLQRSIY